MKKIMFALLIIAMFLATTISATAYNSVDAAVSGSLALGETKIFQVGAIDYEVSLRFVSGRSAKFQVNGEVTDLIEVGARDFLADNTEIGVIEVSGNKVEFYLGEKVMISKPTLGQPLVEDKLTYDKCVSSYLEEARSVEYRQNYPEADRIKEEGLRVCGEMFGKLVPVPPKYSESDHYRCMMEGSEQIQAIAEEGWTDEAYQRAKLELEKKCEKFIKVVEANPEYESCMKGLEEFKQMLVQRYSAQSLEVPAELMQKYEEMIERCRILSGEWRTTRPMPEEATLPAIDIPEEDLSRPEEFRPKPMPPEFRRDCSGCVWEDNCLPIGTRLVKENGEQKPLFCNIYRELESQRSLGEQCQNNYECVSNSCQDGVCQSIGAKIEGIEKELREQRGIMEKILGFFSRIFGR